MLIYQAIVIAVITTALRSDGKLYIPIARLPGFQNDTKGLDSGCVLILDEKIIIVTELSFDGRCYGATFSVGVGSRRFPIPYQFENHTTLRGQDAQLKLPKELSVYKMEWLAVSCKTFKNDQEFVRLNPSTFYYELLPFTQHQTNLRSGPILLINERTIFLSNLVYNGSGVEDARFWVGKGEPGENGTPLLDELGTNRGLELYTGEDVYLKLPKSMTVHDIDYFGVWSESRKYSFGSTKISSDVPQLPKDGSGKFDDKENYIARIPRCCPNGYTRIAGGCSKHFSYIKPLPIYYGNMTDLDTKPIPEVVYAPYNYFPQCRYGMYYLDGDEKFYLLTSGHLFLNDSGDLLSKDDFCISAIYDKKSGWIDTPYLCFPEEYVLMLPAWVYNTCVCFSVIFLIITMMIFILIDDARASRGFNTIGFSVSTTLMFICLGTSGIIPTTKIGCAVLDVFFNFFLVSSFIWLFFLSYETYYRLINVEIPHNSNRSYKYSIISTVIPFANMLLSFLIPNGANRNEEDAEEEEEYNCRLTSGKLNPFYYIPVTVFVLLNTGMLIWTWMYNNKLSKNNYRIWPLGRMETNMRLVYRSCFILAILMSTCWMSEVIFNSVNAESGLRMAFKLLNSLQGVFIFLVFVVHNPVLRVVKEVVQQIRHRANFNTSEVTPLKD